MGLQGVSYAPSVHAGIIETMKCLTCNTPLPERGIRRGGHQKYCSVVCRNRAYGKPCNTYSDTCLNCNAPNPQTRIGRTGRPTNYCSITCRRSHDWQKQKSQLILNVPDRIVNCDSCGTVFTTRRKAQRFCSYDCRQSDYRFAGFAKRAESKKTVFEYECDLCKELIIRYSPLGGHKRYHPECSKIAEQARYRKKTVKRQSNAKPSGVYVEQLIERDGYLCYLCQEPIDMKVPRTSKRGATVDHVIPLSRGGSDEMDNLKLAHWICNNKKSNKLVEEL